MRVVKRSAIVFSMAALVPLLLIGIFFIASLLQQVQHEAEDKTVTRADAYLSRVDELLARDLGALSALAASRAIRSASETEARERAAGVAAEFPQWKNVILSNATTGEQVWQTVGPAQQSRMAARQEVVQFASRGVASEVGGFDEAWRECRCVTLHRRLVVDGSVYVITLEREVADFQKLLLAAIDKAEVAALVDRKGLFVARTSDYDTRLGTPATQFVRDAVAQGGKGLYSGTTFEGLRNRSAYTTSGLSGWSAHIAVPATTYNMLSAGYFFLAALLAVAVALISSGAGIWLAIHNLSASRREERARMQSQKLEAMGHLSGVVAHDFNNLLSIMSACLRLLGKSENGIKREQVIEEGLLAADRGAKLVRQLLTFAREKLPELDCVDLNSTIEGIHYLLIRSLGRRNQLQVSLATDARFVRTNKSQLELVLLNLTVNARDAMPEGGVLSITSKRSSDPDYVDLMVGDTGIGMSEEIAARAVQPFFTTKPEGEGTGLGLSQAHLLLKDSGGSLHVESALGKGTVITLRFLACEIRTPSEEP